MTFQDPGVDHSFEAGTTLIAAQHLFVTLASDEAVDLAAKASTATPVGVLQNDPILADMGTVRVSGMTKLVAGETIAAGQLITASAVTAGRCDVADATGNVILGMARTGGDAGEVITVMLFGGPGGEIS